MSDPLGLIQNTGGPSPIKPQQGGPNAAQEQQGPEFKNLLMDQIEEVNKLQKDADMAIEDVASGRRDDMDAVLVAKQKADVAFQMLVQVRNKMMDAYEEVKQIRV